MAEFCFQAECDRAGLLLICCSSNLCSSASSWGQRSGLIALSLSKCKNVIKYINNATWQGSPFLLREAVIQKVQTARRCTIYSHFWCKTSPPKSYTPAWGRQYHPRAAGCVQCCVHTCCQWPLQGKLPDVAVVATRMRHLCPHTSESMAFVRPTRVWLFHGPDEPWLQVGGQRAVQRHISPQWHLEPGFLKPLADPLHYHTAWAGLARFHVSCPRSEPAATHLGFWAVKGCKIPNRSFRAQVRNGLHLIPEGTMEKIHLSHMWGTGTAKRG